MVAAGALTMGGAGFARYAFPLLLPDMREGLRATYGQMGLLATGNNIGYVISSLLGGILSARYGARRVISISMFLAGATTFATGLSPGIEFALAVQFLTGLAAGGCVVPALGLVATWFEPRKRGLATGLAVGGMPLGILASSRFLPVVLTSLGEGAWRYGWMLMGVLVVLLGLVALLLVRDRPRQAAPSDGAEGANPATPLDWGQVYRSRSVWLLCAINSGIGVAGGIFATFFVAYLVAQRALTAPQAGEVWGLTGLAGTFSGLVWGSISDLVGRKTALAACYYVFFLALAILTFVPLPGAHYVSAALGGLTLFGGMAISVALTGDVAGPRLAPAAFGFVSLFFNLGQAVSPSLAGSVIDATGSFITPLLVATAVTFGAASLCFLIRPPRMEEAL